jgi:glycosyltransferase involved in cell wall biosynthesis
MSKYKIGDVSVLICCKNSAVTINSCLERVAAQKPYEIIIVDGDSVDGTLEICREYTKHIYSDDRRGLGYARSLGASKVKTEFVCIVSPDDVICENFLSIAVCELRERQQEVVALLAPKIMINPKTFWDKAQFAHYQLMTTQSIRVVGNPSVYRTSAIQRYDFDCFFSANEDTDLCERWARDGLKVDWGKKFFTIEVESRSHQEFKKRYVWYGEGDYRFFKKWWGVNKKVSIRHFFHPLKNYVLKYPYLFLIKGDFTSAYFCILCGTYRYLGMIKESLK